MSIKKKKLPSKNILITGGAGFIGAHTALRLIEEDYSVILVDNNNNYYSPQLKRDRVSFLLNKKRFKQYKVDITDLDSLSEVFADNKIDIVIHQAAQAGVRYSLLNPFAYNSSNINGTLNVLECCRQFKIEKLVFASSSSVYGERSNVPFKEEDNTDNPISFYAATKKMTETMCYAYHSLYGIKMVGLRYFTCYGEWGRPDMAFFNFTENIIKGKTINVFNNGKLERDFTYIADIVEGVFQATFRDFDYEIFNLGCGKPVKILDFIKILEEVLGQRAKVKFIPAQKGDVTTTYADISKAKKMLQWSPETDLAKGIERFATWYRDYYQVNEN